MPSPKCPHRWKGEREGGSLLRTPITCGEASILSIPKALLLNRPLFEEPLLNDPNKDVISSLGSMYEKEVTKKVLDLLKDSTPFQLATSISNLPYLDKVLYLLFNDFKWVFFFFLWLRWCLFFFT